MTELGKVKAEITDFEKKLLTLHQGPQNRQTLEEIIQYEKKLNDLQIVEKRLKSLVQKQAIVTQIGELEAQIDDWHGKIEKVHEEIVEFGNHTKSDPLLSEIVDKYGLRVFNQIKGLFYEIDNLSARMRHNLEEIQRLNSEVDNLS